MMSLQIFLEFFLDKYALIKEKIVRDNEGPFITKKLIKAIMNRSKFKKQTYKMAVSLKLLGI